MYTLLLSLVLLTATAYGLFRLYKSKRIKSSWKVLICVVIVGCVAYAFSWSYDRVKLTGQKAAEENMKQMKQQVETEELKIGEIHHVSYSDGSLEIKINSLDTIPMPDNAVNIILGFDIYNKSNETFLLGDIYINASDDYGTLQGNRHEAQASIYDPELNTFVDVNQARARMMLNGNPLAAMPHKHYQDALSFFVNRGKNAVIFANTIIGYITLDKTANYSRENHAEEDEFDYSDDIPEDYVDLNTIFNSNGTCDYNRFRLDEFDETQQEYLKQEGIYYDEEQACWRKRK